MRAAVDVGAFELQRRGERFSFILGEAEAFAAELSTQGRDVEIRQVNPYIHTVWARPAVPPPSAPTPAPTVPKSDPTAVSTRTLLDRSNPKLVPHPLMFQVAESDGSLKPEFHDYEELLPLEPGTLDPVWWPHRVNGEDLTAAQRHADFSLNLDETYQALKKDSPKSASTSPPAPASNSASPSLGNSKPHLVLRALLRLRGATMPDDRPTFD